MPDVRDSGSQKRRSKADNQRAGYEFHSDSLTTGALLCFAAIGYVHAVTPVSAYVGRVIRAKTNSQAKNRSDVYLRLRQSYQHGAVPL